MKRTVRTNISTLTGTSFLDEVLERIVSHPLCESGALHRLAIVLPSHRAKSKLRKALVDKIEGPVRLPRFFALSGFVESSSPWTAADPLEILARFYLLVHEEQPDMTFDRFVSWATVVLNDFAAVDHELAEVNHVFQNLADIQGIEDWSFGEAPWSEDQKAFERQWRRLPNLYNKLHEELERDGLATRARLTRVVAEQGGKLDVDHVLVAGLATLSTAEWRCLEHWERLGKLTIMWDGDNSYVNDQHNDAGLFIRKHRRTEPSNERDGIATSPPKVVSVNCTSTVSQTQYVRNVLSSLTSEDLNKTLVVLPDAKSLGTLMQSIQVPNDRINVTMGVALHETPIVSFVDHVFAMLETKRTSWRLDHVQWLLAHPVMLQLVESEESKAKAIQALHELARAFHAWVQPSDFDSRHAPEFAQFLRQLNPLQSSEATPFLEALNDWTLELEQRMHDVPSEIPSPEDTDSEDNEGHIVPWIPIGWKRFRTVIAVLSRLQKAHRPMTDAREVRAMVKRLLRQERIDLLGEPDEGLQIMGLSETRALDFDRVLILDMNEGIVPQFSTPDSFLPLDLRHALNMPGPREREARYAYLIHRLLNRSKEVHLLHRGASEANGGAEPSRYLMQLTDSFHRANGAPYLNIQHRVQQLPLPDARPDIPPLQMTPKLQGRLQEWSSSGMSPSAINTMLQCPRNFAYRYLYRMDEANDLQTSMEASTLGSVVHYVMEQGLKGVQGRFLEITDLDQIKSSLNGLLQEAVQEVYNADLVQQGENVLQLEIARSTLIKFLDKERAELQQGTDAPWIEALEQDLNSSHLKTAAGDLAFRGVADRREQSGGIPRVVDYKTGKVEAKELRLNNDWTAQLEKGDHGKALQLVVYATMVLASLDSRAREHGVLAAIRSGRNVREGLLHLEIDGQRLFQPSHAETFVHWLAEQLVSYAAMDHHIRHNTKSQYCSHCVVLDQPESYTF